MRSGKLNKAVDSRGPQAFDQVAVAVRDTGSSHLTAGVPSDSQGLEARVKAKEAAAAQKAAGITIDELRLAGRNHSLPLEALDYAVTPIGMHYLLSHFDIPLVDHGSWRLSIGGRVRSARELTLEQIKAMPAVTLAVTLECAGNGRALLSPRPISQPWLNEAVGTAEWTGTRLRPLLESVGLLDDAREVVFTGLDRGLQDGVEHLYERSLSREDALRDEVLLAYAINGQPLPPQHGFPLRLIVPGWYGMTQVKWIQSITVTSHPFKGLQQAVKYQVKRSPDDPGHPVTRILPRSLMVPPGIPDFMSRIRYLEPGPHLLRGRAWSGWAPISRVEVSSNAGQSWHVADLGKPPSRYAWRPWSFSWQASDPGEYELCSRASDEAGNSQPLEQAWSVDGVCNNAVQRIRVVVAGT